MEKTLGTPRLPIFDLHCDTLDRLGWPLLADDLNGGETSYAPDDKGKVPAGTLQDFATSRGHLSLQGMSAFAWCQCLAVFVPDYLTVEQSARFFQTISGTVPAHVEAHGDLLAMARTAVQIDEVLGSGKNCGVLTIENGKLLAASADMIERIAQLGVRMVTLTWNAENPLGSGNETQHGLTSFGRAMVQTLEARKIVVDVSHLNDPGFWDVESCARRPFVASHSNARAICAHPRNLTDDQFRAIRDAGGVVGLNYYNEFVTQGCGEYEPAELLAHVEHWLDLDGEDVVALGSDYDGCDVPGWLNPCDKMADLVELFRRHFGDEIARKLCFQNAYELFRRIDAE